MAINFTEAQISDIVARVVSEFKKPAAAPTRKAEKSPAGKGSKPSRSGQKSAPKGRRTPNS